MLSDHLLSSSPAVAFKNAKQLEQAKEAYLLEAEAHTNHRAYPPAALSLVDWLLVCIINLIMFVLDSLASLFHAAKWVYIWLLIVQINELFVIIVSVCMQGLRAGRDDAEGECLHLHLSDAFIQRDLEACVRACVFLSQDMQRLPEAIQYIEKASVMYVENGTPDTAAMALDRAGKCVLHKPAYSVGKITLETLQTMLFRRKWNKLNNLVFWLNCVPAALKQS